MKDLYCRFIHFVIVGIKYQLQHVFDDVLANYRDNKTYGLFLSRATISHQQTVVVFVCLFACFLAVALAS